MNDEETLRTNRIQKLREEWEIDATGADDDALLPAFIIRNGSLSIAILPTAGDGMLHVELQAFNYGASIDSASLMVRG